MEPTLISKILDNLEQNLEKPWPRLDATYLDLKEGSSHPKPSFPSRAFDAKGSNFFYEDTFFVRSTEESQISLLGYHFSSPPHRYKELLEEASHLLIMIKTVQGFSTCPEVVTKENKDELCEKMLGLVVGIMEQADAILLNWVRQEKKKFPAPN
jgi:hypothetical protein